MANASSTLCLLLALSFITLISTANSFATKTSVPSNFVRSSCTVTRYPALCVESLAIFSTSIQKSPRQLAQTALAVSLSRARSAKVFVTKLSRSKGMKRREYQAMRDCVDTVGDSVDRLSKSMPELGHLGQSKAESFLWHMSNVQTWVSAALTDDNTCMDGFAGKVMDGKAKTAIRAKVTHVAQVTSNALALVNQYANVH